MPNNKNDKCSKRGTCELKNYLSKYFNLNVMHFTQNQSGYFLIEPRIFGFLNSVTI